MMLRGIKGKKQRAVLGKEESLESHLCTYTIIDLRPMWFTHFNYCLLERWPLIAQADVCAPKCQGSLPNPCYLFSCLTWGCSKSKIHGLKISQEMRASMPIKKKGIYAKRSVQVLRHTYLWNQYNIYNIGSFSSHLI